MGHMEDGTTSHVASLRQRAATPPQPDIHAISLALQHGVAHVLDAQQGRGRIIRSGILLNDPTGVYGGGSPNSGPLPWSSILYFTLKDEEALAGVEKILKDAGIEYKAEPVKSGQPYPFIFVDSKKPGNKEKIDGLLQQSGREPEAFYRNYTERRTMP